jgi:GNAT superfamily N-acetyltransferase
MAPNCPVTVLHHRSAVSWDAPEDITLRGQTRENAVSVSGLASIGITAESWGKRIEAGDLSGHACADNGRMATALATSTRLPEYENRGIGRMLLSRVADDLWSLGFKRLFLGSKDPSSRSSAGISVGGLQENLMRTLMKYWNCCAVLMPEGERWAQVA